MLSTLAGNSILSADDTSACEGDHRRAQEHVPTEHLRDVATVLVRRPARRAAKCALVAGKWKSAATAGMVSGAATGASLNGAQFLSEWDNTSGTEPKVEKVYQISIPRGPPPVPNRSFFDPTSLTNAAAPSTRRPKSASSTACSASASSAPKGPALCSFRSCGICSIVKSSFHEFTFGKKANCGRCGDGVYAFRNPSLADGHSTSATSTPYRVMIACDAAVASNAETSR
ncbi:unnamed protein product [Mycena citricolor]|uniref:Uncharacterized protein n=1 Tax=Mycena citricolor TaxID=2018698 RepID=A0AAD2Q296_9AGAR|nr:unnamed protein product [Mycena citricolor]